VTGSFSKARSAASTFVRHEADPVLPEGPALGAGLVNARVTWLHGVLTISPATVYGCAMTPICRGRTGLEAFRHVSALLYGHHLFGPGEAGIRDRPCHDHFSAGRAELTADVDVYPGGPPEMVDSGRQQVAKLGLSPAKHPFESSFCERSLGWCDVRPSPMTRLLPLCGDMPTEIEPAARAQRTLRRINCRVNEGQNCLKARHQPT